MNEDKNSVVARSATFLSMPWSLFPFEAPLASPFASARRRAPSAASSACEHSQKHVDVLVG